MFPDIHECLHKGPHSVRAYRLSTFNVGIIVKAMVSSPAMLVTYLGLGSRLNLFGIPMSTKCVRDPLEMDGAVSSLCMDRTMFCDRYQTLAHPVCDECQDGGHLAHCTCSAIESSPPASPCRKVGILCFCSPILFGKTLRELTRDAN